MTSLRTDTGSGPGSGTLYGLGVGPGDPDLITVKALRLLRAAPVIAYPANEAGDSLARRIAAPHLPAGRVELPFRVPFVTDRAPAQAVYDQVAVAIAAHLDAGRDVALLCEGDPFFYGSFQYLFTRLADRFPVEVVPGIASVMAAAAVAGVPLTARNDVLTVLPATLPEETLRAGLLAADSAVIMKLGRHLPKVRALLASLGRLSWARYVERATMAEQRVLPLGEVPGDDAPYFSLVLVQRPASAPPEDAS